jgi:hypothetical protein
MLFSAAPSCGWFAAMPRRTRASALTRAAAVSKDLAGKCHST